MKFADACKTGEQGWALRLSGNNLLVGKDKIAHIYTDEEHIELKLYISEGFKDWMPLLSLPPYISEAQAHDWHRAKYKNFRKQELDGRIDEFKKYIKGTDDKQST
jgi:hypothetical protein